MVVKSSQVTFKPQVEVHLLSSDSDSETSTTDPTIDTVPHSTHPLLTYEDQTIDAHSPSPGSDQEDEQGLTQQPGSTPDTHSDHSPLQASSASVELGTDHSYQATATSASRAIPGNLKPKTSTVTQEKQHTSSTPAQHRQTLVVYTLPTHTAPTPPVIAVSTTNKLQRPTVAELQVLQKYRRVLPALESAPGSVPRVTPVYTKLIASPKPQPTSETQQLWASASEGSPDTVINIDDMPVQQQALVIELVQHGYKTVNKLHPAMPPCCSKVAKSTTLLHKLPADWTDFAGDLVYFFMEEKMTLVTYKVYKNKNKRNHQPSEQS